MCAHLFVSVPAFVCVCIYLCVCICKCVYVCIKGEGWGPKWDTRSVHTCTFYNTRIVNNPCGLSVKMATPVQIAKQLFLLDGQLLANVAKI